MFKRTGHQIQLLILAAIVVLNVFDFLELLDPFWDYVKKIVSWVLVGVLFYHISPSDVLLGVKKRLYDFAFIVVAFVMNVNDILSYAWVAREGLVLHAVRHLQFIPRALDAAGAGVTLVTNVTQESWNTISLLGVVPDAPARAAAYATQVTMGGLPGFVFSFGGESSGFVLQPIGLNGALLQLYNTILPHAAVIEEVCLSLGLLALVLMAVWAALRIPVKRPSLGAVIHEEGDARGVAGVAVRTVAVFVMLLFFLLFVFNLVLEWLAVAIDAPILMGGLCGSLLVFFVNRRRAGPEGGARWLEIVGNFGTDFYERFIRLFHYRKHVLLGVAGLLVLHILTELANFLLPFVMPMRDSLYLSQLGAGHENLFVLASKGFGASWVQNGSAILAVALVVVAWACLLGLPGYIWYKIVRLRHEEHERHYPRFAPWVLGLMYAAGLVAFFVPVISFRRLDVPGLVGVDFLTHSVWEVARVGLPELLLVAVALFAVVFFLSLFERVRPFLIAGPLLASVLFMGAYVYMFFLSSFKHYLVSALNSFASGAYGLGVAFFLFLVMSVLFYISGYFLFLYEIIRD